MCKRGSMACSRRSSWILTESPGESDLSTNPAGLDGAEPGWRAPWAYAGVRQHSGALSDGPRPAFGRGGVRAPAFACAGPRQRPDTLDLRAGVGAAMRTPACGRTRRGSEGMALALAFAGLSQAKPAYAKLRRPS